MRSGSWMISEGVADASSVTKDDGDVGVIGVEGIDSPTEDTRRVGSGGAGDGSEADGERRIRFIVATVTRSFVG